MIVSIIGSGALGKIYGGLLAQANHEVHYLMRSEYNEIHKSQYFNLVFIDPENLIRIEDPIIHNHPNQLPASDLVIIALKTTENAHISSLIAHCLKDDSMVLVIQNGIGNEEWISRFTGKCPLICGISTVGAYRADPLTVDIAFMGDLKIAPYQMKDLELCQSLSLPLSAAFNYPVHVYKNYKEIRWHKLLWNIPFATLSIIYDKSTNILASTQPYATIVRNVISEVVDIAASEGVKITQDYIEKMLASTQKNKNYYPSMYRDYVEGKAIEKEYFIDNVLEIAKKHDIKTPMLNLIESKLAQS
ncbi:MAG: ketopantoate reductase family protein [Candidatus Berkiella sp.]